MANTARHALTARTSSLPEFYGDVSEESPFKPEQKAKPPLHEAVQAMCTSARARLDM